MAYASKEYHTRPFKRIVDACVTEVSCYETVYDQIGCYPSKANSIAPGRHNEVGQYKVIISEERCNSLSLGSISV